MTLFWKTLVGFSFVSWMVIRDPQSSFFHSIINPIFQIYEILPQLTQPKLECSILGNTEAYMTTADIIRNRGYPLEVHQTITKDGFILELHRIPFGRNGPPTNSSVRSRPVFLQHGLMASDHVWLINPTNNSLAYLLVEQGYDVWMGNSRGNSNSRKHISLDPQKDEEYWDYSWDEMGRYDIPASVDYVLNVTRQEKLAAYVGHSLGCALFFIGAIHEPKLNSQVEKMIGLGATSSTAHLNNPFYYLGLVVKPYHFLLRLTRTTIIHPNNSLPNNLLRLFCETSWLGAAVCTRLLFQIFGFSESYNESTLHTISGHYPDGGSVGTMVQFLQNSNSGEAFHYFDYGPTENLRRYGSSAPAEYNLSLVTAPVYLISGDNDPIAPPEDISWLAASLGNLKESIHIDGHFTHGDFIWSTRAAELVHRPLISLLSTSFI